MKPVSGGYADVNGIRLYHEIYGQGEPLVLIHGGLTTIGEMQEWVQSLATTRQVAVVEMQGHGRTADCGLGWVRRGVRGLPGAQRVSGNRRSQPRSRLIHGAKDAPSTTCRKIPPAEPQNHPHHD